MPFSALDAVIFVEEPPQFEIRDGLVHIVQHAGSMRLERVMSLHVFMRTIRAANKALAEYNASGGMAEVIVFPTREDEAREA
jgi:hypothetical protein